MNLGIGLSLTSFQRVPTVPLEDLDAAIAALFGPTDVGAWYDPSDSTTVFQDAAGTTPATVGDPVGLILDKSKGLTLGAEEVTNGTFDADTDWVKGTGWTIGSGVLTASASSAAQSVYQSGTWTAGATYKVTADVTVISGTLQLWVDGVTKKIDVTSTRSVSQYFTASNSSGRIVQLTSNSFQGTVDNVSIRELPGNHATQTTSAARPVLQQSGDLYYLDFDGVDDFMGPVSFADQPQPFSMAAGAAIPTDLNVYLIDGTELNRNIISSGSATYPDAVGLYAGRFVYFDAANDGSESVYVAHFEDTSPALRKNGIGLSSYGGTIGGRSWGGITLGARWSGTAAFSASKIYSFIGVNRTLDPDELVSVERYLGTKSGFTAPVITGVPTIS